MPAHSNKTIQKHIESTTVLLDKMHTLTTQLQDNLFQNFQKLLGTPLPSVVVARVRQIDIAMVFSTDASVDEYVIGARTLLKAGLGGDNSEIADKALDFVCVLAKKIIGSGSIQIGVHSTSGWVGDFVMACLGVVERAKAADWATQADFFVGSYALVLWKPASAHALLLAQPPEAQAAVAMPAGATVSQAELSYRYEPLHL